MENILDIPGRDFYQGIGAFQAEFNRATNQQWNEFLFRPSPSLNIPGVNAGARILREIATREAHIGSDRFGHEVVFIRASGAEHVASYQHHLMLAGINSGIYRGRQGAYYVTVRRDDWNERISDLRHLDANPSLHPATIPDKKPANQGGTLKSIVEEQLKASGIRNAAIEISNGIMKVNVQNGHINEVKRALGIQQRARIRCENNILIIPVHEVAHLIPVARRRIKPINTLRSFHRSLRRLAYRRRYSWRKLFPKESL